MERGASPVGEGASPSGADLPRWTAVLRAHAELFGALTLMALVLAVLDVASLGSPLLLLSIAPLVFLVLVAVGGVSRSLCAAWIGGCVGAACLLGDARFAGLAYPAVVLGVLAEVHRLVWGRR